MTDRERFEAWFRADIEDDDEYSEYSFLMNEDEYRDEKTDIVWAAWQASRKQALEDAAVKIETTWAGTSHDLVCRVFAGIVRSVANPEGEQG